MKTICPILLLILFSSILSYSQVDEAILFKGKVVDENGKEIVSANISDHRGILRETSDINGEFYLNIFKDSIEISISHIGFKTLTTELRLADLKIIENQLTKEFVLQKSIEQIDLVSISSEAIERVYNNPSILIYDFAFHGDNILLLLKSDRKRFLRLVNNKSETLLEIELDFKAKEIFSACMGDLLIISDEDCYRIDLNENIELVWECNYSDFNKLIEPCVALTSESLLTVKFGDHNKSVTYYITDVVTAETRILDFIIDMQASLASDFHVERMKKMAGVNSVGELGAVGLSSSRELFQDYSYYKLIMTRPIYAPIMYLDNELVVFDHVNSTIKHYTSFGVQILSHDMSYDNDTEEIKNIIKDAQRDNVYAFHYKNGTARLTNIDHQTGEKIEEFKLDKHTFPEKIKIRNGYAYYIYQEKRNISVPNIFRQKLR